MGRKRMSGTRGRRLTAVLLALAATGACSDSLTESAPDPLLHVISQDGLTFMTQNVHPDAHMMRCSRERS